MFQLLLTDCLEEVDALSAFPSSRGESTMTTLTLLKFYKGKLWFVWKKSLHLPLCLMENAEGKLRLGGRKIGFLILSYPGVD